MPSLRFLVALAALTANASAHLSIWTPAMFGFEPNEINTSNMSQPLQDYPFSTWWWHGALDLPPAADQIFALTPNATIDIAISSNKGQTPFGSGWASANPRLAPDPWTNADNGWGNMHAPARTDVAGSALGIAYKSDAHAVTPDDFVIFSVKHDSPARQLETFAVPDLPACPDGRCMCAWFWIHKSIGGTDQMYMAPFVCDVVGATNTRSLARPAAPRKCGSGGVKGCVQGAKSPMYWKNLEGNNMWEPGHEAPTYSTEYGFEDGAQVDLWVDGHNGTTPEDVVYTTATQPSAGTTITETAAPTTVTQRARRHRVRHAHHDRAL
ncbi:hypothetical protein EDC01DRAFT_696887 [Geopyxis carbonaria]|nr:hypothetical protein EDC01DRAFT_696887 [Geopyxis carbonaria]